MSPLNCWLQSNYSCFLLLQFEMKIKYFIHHLMFFLQIHLKYNLAIKITIWQEFYIDQYWVWKWPYSVVVVYKLNSIFSLSSNSLCCCTLKVPCHTSRLLNRTSCRCCQLLHIDTFEALHDFCFHLQRQQSSSTPLGRLIVWWTHLDWQEAD